jgi:Leucine-rich repeat (LRR) protein
MMTLLKPLLFLGFVVILVCGAVNPCLNPISQTEYDGLLGLYTSTTVRGDWNWKLPYSQYGYPWNFTDVEGYLGQPCGNSWQGIICAQATEDDTTCSIVSIVLDDYRLVGQIPDNIGALANLLNFSLGFNEFASIPSSLQFLTNLQSLNLQSSGMQGSIPRELGLMVSLQNINLRRNVLRSQIPSELYGLTSLINIDLDINRLTGSIATNIGLLVHLRHLTMEVNILNGSLPTEIGLMTSLRSICLNFNYITGSFPVEVGQMLSLESVQLSNNALDGSLPTELWSLPYLTTLDIGANGIVSTIPSYIGLATSLQSLNLFFNRLYGAIPSEIALMTACAFLNIMGNSLNGPLPVEIWSMPSLAALRVAGNSLSYSLPTEIGNFKSLQYLGLANCNLFGDIPSEIWKLSLIELDLSDNHMSGTLPEEIAAITGLRDLRLESNSLTASLPSFASSTFASINAALISDNLLTGEVAADFFGALNSVEYMELSNNYFSHSIASSVQSMRNHPSFFADSNYFSGSIAQLSIANFSMFTVPNNLLTGRMFRVDRTTHQWLNVVSVAGNAFSGSLPSELFSLSKLEALVASGNCFSGELQLDCGPDDAWCENSVLSQLSLNELSSGFNCRKSVIPKSLSGAFSNAGYYPEAYMSGSIPFESFFKFDLVSLYLEGNGFEGQLPESMVIPSRLLNISVAFNQLTGSVPAMLQESITPYAYFDVSRNRLSGTISKGFQSKYMDNPDVDLSSNRLSGKLYDTESNSWDTLYSNMMKGNLFQLDSSELGQSSPNDKQQNAVEYNGSGSLNVAMIVSAMVFTYAGAVAICVVGRKATYGTDMSQYFEIGTYAEWKSHVHKLLAENILLASRLKDLYFILSVGAGTLVLIYIILFAVLKASALQESFSTHTYQYSWLLSAVFMHGTAPVLWINVLLVGILAVIGCTLLLSFVHYGGQYWNNSSRGFSIATSQNRCCNHENVQFYLLLGFASVANVTVVALVNWAYLLAILRNNQQLLLVQFAVSLFKCIWNNSYIPAVSRYLQFKRDSTASAFRYTLLLLNVVVIPCFINSLASEECFSQLFEQMTAPTAEPVCFATFNEDGIVTLRCSNEVPLSAPFTYSYQCSSALIVNYVPVLLYAYALSGFVVPSLMVAYMHFHGDGVGNTRLSFLEGMAPRLLRLQAIIPPPQYENYDENCDDDGLASNKLVVADAADAADPNSVGHSVPPLLPISWFSSNLVLDCVLFLTFGVSFPYLGVVIVFAHGNAMGVWSLALGRYRRHLFANRTFHMNTFDSAIISSLAKFQFATQDFVVISLVCFLFWGVVCFDMIADVYGVRHGMSAALSIATVCPSVLMGSVFVYYRIAFSPAASRAVSSEEVDNPLVESILPKDDSTESNVVL